MRRIAVIGGGIAGLVVAWLLKDSAEVVLYERDEWLGGHSRSVPVSGSDGAIVQAETGFKYMFDATHPQVLALIRALGVTVHRTPMSTSVRVGGRRCVVLPPRSPRQVALLLAQPMALRGALALARIRLQAAKVVREADWEPVLRSYLEQRFSRRTCEHFLLPFFAASWGMPIDVLAGFAAYDVVKVVGKAWGGFLEVAGGVGRYVEALVAELQGVELRRATPVRSVRRDGAALLVEADDVRHFDHVVLATPGDCVPSLLAAEPSAAALRTVCGRFGYVDTEIAIHRDATMMPPRRADWAVINYTLNDESPFITDWCGHREGSDVFRTWLAPGREPPRDICHRQRFRHLVVTPRSAAAQSELVRLQGAGGLWTVGMYATDVDVQESSVRSALAVAAQLAPESQNLSRIGGLASSP